MVAIGLGLFIISVLLVNLFGADIKGIPNKADYIFGFTAFSGIVIYIATSHILPEAHARHSSRWTLAATLGGVAIMWALVSQLEAVHVHSHDDAAHSEIHQEEGVHEDKGHAEEGHHHEDEDHDHAEEGK